MVVASEAPRKKVQVWIRARGCGMDERDLFLILRTTPERGAFWQPVTGSVELGETVEQAALREMKEETGLSPSGQIKPISKPFEFQSRGRRFIEYPFLADVDAGSCMKVANNPREHEEYEWASEKRARQLVKFESNTRILEDLVQSEERKS